MEGIGPKDFTKLFQKTNLPILTTKERQKASLLVVESDPAIRNRLRQILTSLDIGHVADAVDHASALKKIEEHNFSHVLFESKKTSMPIKEFLTKVLEYDNRVIPIACSYQPSVDDVFDLLIYGARSFLVKPFTTESVDEAMIWATKGERLSDSVLNAKNRNEALALLVLNNLGKLTTVLKQSRFFETAKREIPKRKMALQHTMELARTFAHGGEMGLLETLIELSAQRSEEPASRLGKVRKMLGGTRKGPKGDGPEDEKLNEISQALEAIS